MTKQDYIEIFQDTMRKCESEPTLKNAIADSLAKQYVLLEKEPLKINREPNGSEAEIVVSGRRTFEAAEQYKGKKVCALNFASSKNPGGGVANGARAQEECICRISTMYPCLVDDRVFGKFYQPHRTMFRDTLYNSDLIFTPGIVSFKTDDNEPKLRPEDEWFSVDVITCAAPNLSAFKRLENVDLEQLLMKRVERIFITAVNEGAEVLILGAFGCGAFRNPPDVVAGVMKKLTDKYSRYFEVIEFAVYCSPKNPANLVAFQRALGR